MAPHRLLSTSSVAEPVVTPPATPSGPTTGPFNCAAGNPIINNGNPVECSTAGVPVSIQWVDENGDRSTFTGFQTLSVDIGTITFDSSNPPDPTNNYLWQIPFTSSTDPVTATFTYGDPSNLCSFTHEIQPCAATPPPATGSNHDGSGNVVPLQRQYPGYGGAALDDSLVNSVYFMTTLNPTGTGSFSAAPNDAYIVPLVAGKIVSDDRINMPQNNVRFLGQLAPGHLSINGTTTFNSKELVVFEGSNTLWEHFSIRCSDNPNQADTGSHGPFSVHDGPSGSLSGVVLSNLSLHYGSDDCGSTFYDSTDITLYRLLAGHAVSTNSAGGKHDNGILMAGSSSKITFFQNLMMTSGRSPLIQETQLVQAVNSVVYHTDSESTSNQIYAISQGGRPAVNQTVNFHDNLDIRYTGSASNIWTGQANGSTLDLYANNNQYRNCAGVYTDMGFTSGVSNVGNRNAPQHSMPSLPAITDLTQLESFLLPKVGNYLTRDSLDDDVINTINSCSAPAVENTASNYFSNPWPVGPTKPALTIWDQASPDGLSDAAKAACNIPAGTNLLSPNDGRWEAVVDFHSGGLLSASVA